VYQDIINFWFKEIEPSYWWKKDKDFDRLIAERYKSLHQKAARCELFEWRQELLGRLAEIIILDQFSRNLFRDSPLAFATDGLALVLAQEAVSLSIDAKLSPTERSFLYMPYMHSESVLIHEVAVTLFQAKGMEQNLEFELKHKIIIDRFHRYPHRNAILGRESTEEELEFLKEPNSSF